jgi:fructokinase
MARGRLLHGLVHPEMGHVPVPRDPRRDPFLGCCPFHGDCLEGLASGPAIEARWGRPAEALHGRADVWDLEAEYLAAGIAAIALVLSPQRVILGGGVGRAPGLLERVRERLAARLRGYVRHARMRGDLSDFLVPPALGDRAGVLGALALAGRACGRSTARGSRSRGSR